MLYTQALDTVKVPSSAAHIQKLIIFVVPKIMLLNV
jgi:hypothetical protein